MTDYEEVHVGTPTIPSASVTAMVLGEQLGDKMIIFKYKQMVRYRRRTGHRQHYTQLRVEGINLEGRGEEAAPEKPEKPEKKRARGRAGSE